MASDRRLPLQGGLPPMEGVGGVVEIACDESGFSGSNMLDAATPVFTHASVDLSVDEAVELIGVLRSGFRRSWTELKSGTFLRGPQAGEALGRLLAALDGRAHVLVVDKEYFLVTRIVDLFLTEPSYAAGTRLTQERRPAALALYRGGRAADGREWRAFLAAFVELVRTKRTRPMDHHAVLRFFQARDALQRVGLGGEADDVLDGLDRARVGEVLTRLAHDDRSIPPPLEPMLPALAETVLFWSGGQHRVLVIHDEQSALTAGRLRRLQQVLTDGAALAGRVSPLAGLVTVDSRDDPRIQVADLLAGVARQERNDGDDSLLRPFVSPTSLHDREAMPDRS
ncbi:MAG: hypothetical protein J2P22_11375 [Nocardioides sp.]|nr:hypothetical protein [Nocardioides sp.]